MIILLTNDDGIDAPGIRALEEALCGAHEVWVVAPDGERSAGSHAITLRTPVRYRQRSQRSFACSGQPADCVIYSLLGAIPVRPDLVISGINHGPNLGTDLIYSGTAAAARQAALMGVPGLAVSGVTGPDGFDYRLGARIIADRVDLFTALWDEGHFINVNMPADISRDSEFVLATPSKRVYRDELRSFEGPDGSRFFMISGNGVVGDETAGCDFLEVSRGRIAVSPVALQPAAPAVIDQYRESFSGGDE